MKNEAPSPTSSPLSAFQARFDTVTWPAVVEYAKCLTQLSQTVDVLVLMARKSACFADCLSQLGLCTFHCPVVTDRVLDMNLNWLRGKKVALVDDALISGTTLNRAYNALLAAGIPKDRIKSLVLCVNKTSWAEDLFKPNGPYLELDNVSTASLCARIVEAISIIPYPYSIDYPVYKGIRILKRDLDNIFSLPGWHGDDVTSYLQDSNNVFSVTYSPDAALLSYINTTVGFDLSEVSLLKVRLMGRVANGPRTPAWCQILPIVALGPLDLSAVDKMFDCLAQHSTLEGKEIRSAFNAQHLREDTESGEYCSKLRLISFVLASRLAEIWITDVQRSTESHIRYTQDTRSLEFLFPPKFIEIAQCLASTTGPIFSGIKVKNNTAVQNESELSGIIPFNYLELHNHLIEPFLNMYEEKELRARELAKEYGEQVFERLEWKQIIGRLRHGISYSELCSKLESWCSTFQTPKLASLFLDRAIDAGFVVPITCITNKTIYRAYRHGEDVEFTKEYFNLCKLTLSAMAEGAKRTTLPHTWVEKILVLVTRIGLEQGFIKPHYGRMGEFNSIGSGSN